MNYDNFKRIDNKDNIDLYIDKNSKNRYLLTTVINNKNYNLKKVINLNIFKLMFELNKDIIKDMKIDKLGSNDIILLILFNDLAKELGIKKKYMYSKISFINNDNEMIFDGKNIDIDNNNLIDNSYDKIISTYTNLRIKIENIHKIHLFYDFEISIHDELPIYMETLPGLIIKKLILRLKQFIENMS